MTLRDLERTTYRRLNKNVAVPNADTQARIREFINARHRMLLRLPGMDALRTDLFTVTSVAGEPRIALPQQGISRITRIIDSNQQRRIVQRTPDWLRTADPGQHSGTPVVWIPYSLQQVHHQPSDASEVFVVSTSALDTTQAYVEGIITGGYRQTAQVTMTGTTAVSLSATMVNWLVIDKFYLEDDAEGTVTLHEDSGVGTELSHIAPGDRYARFFSFLLWPTPSSAIAYTVDFIREIFDMGNPTDEPQIPLDFHDLLSIGARLDEYEHTDDSRRRLAEIEWDEGVKSLKNFLQNPPDYRPRMGQQRIGYSDVGGWAPADRWYP